MKKQISRQTKRSRPVSKVQTNRRPAKVGIRKRSGSTAKRSGSTALKRSGSTALVNKSKGVRQSSPMAARSDKRVKPQLNEISGRANRDYAARINRAAPKNASFDRPETKQRDLMRQEKTIEPVKSANGNGAAGMDFTNRIFNWTWLDWSNATVAANLRTTEQVIRLPMELLAISSRFASRSWFNLLPLPRRAA